MLGTAQKTHRTPFRVLRHAGSQRLPATPDRSLADRSRTIPTHCRRYRADCHHWLSHLPTPQKLWKLVIMVKKEWAMKHYLTNSTWREVRWQ